ncbi:MAG: PD40 domain-containing protein [Pedobacter sp.]|nr:PD40 domain-containing protein [Pedobacter sp.]
MKHIALLLFLIAVSANCFSQSKGKTYQIAYNVHIPDKARGNYEIFTMEMDGTNKKNITNHPDVSWTYYAYQKKLYFVSDRDTTYRAYFLYETSDGGKSVKKLSNLQLEDSWMSSRNKGSEMIVAGRIGKEIRYQLFLIDTKTGGYKQLTNDTSAKYSDPCFSPNGKQIVYSYQKNKRDRTTHEELFIMNADGTDAKQLTHYPENNPSAKEYGYRAGSAKWHPTENFITYISLQNGRNNIFAVTPKGDKQWKLLNNELSEGWHDWSSDGKWLVFNSSDWKETQYHITLMDWKTKTSKQLTDLSYKAQQSPVFIEK